MGQGVAATAHQTREQRARSRPAPVTRLTCLGVSIGCAQESTILCTRANYVCTYLLTTASTVLACSYTPWMPACIHPGLCEYLQERATTRRASHSSCSLMSSWPCRSQTEPGVPPHTCVLRHGHGLVLRCAELMCECHTCKRCAPDPTLTSTS